MGKKKRLAAKRKVLEDPASGKETEMDQKDVSDPSKNSEHNLERVAESLDSKTKSHFADSADESDQKIGNTTGIENKPDSKNSGGGSENVEANAESRQELSDSKTNETSQETEENKLQDKTTIAVETPHSSTSTMKEDSSEDSREENSVLEKEQSESVNVAPENLAVELPNLEESKNVPEYEDASVMQAPVATLDENAPENSSTTVTIQAAETRESEIPEDGKAVELVKQEQQAEQNFDNSVGNIKGNSDSASATDSHMDSAENTPACADFGVKTGSDDNSMEGDNPTVANQEKIDCQHTLENSSLKATEKERAEEKNTQNPEEVNNEVLAEPETTKNEAQGSGEKLPDSFEKVEDKHSDENISPEPAREEGNEETERIEEEKSKPVKDEQECNRSGSLGEPDEQLNVLDEGKLLVANSAVSTENLDSEEKNSGVSTEPKAADATDEGKDGVSVSCTSRQDFDKVEQIASNSSVSETETFGDRGADMAESSEYRDAKVSETPHSIRKIYGALTGFWKHSGSGKKHTAEVETPSEPSKSPVFPENMMETVADPAEIHAELSKEPLSGADAASFKEDASDTATSGFYSQNTSMATDDNTSLNSLNISIPEKLDSDSTSEASLTLASSFDASSEAVTKDSDELPEKMKKSKNKKGGKSDSTKFNISQKVRFIALQVFLFLF